MLTVRLLAYTMEVMALNNTLKTFTFRSTYYFYFFTFGKDLYGNGVTEVLFYGIIGKFFYKLFGESVGLGEAIFFCLGSVLFFLFAVTYLRGSAVMFVLRRDLP